MTLKNEGGKKGFFVFLLILFIVALGFNMLTPLLADDFSYSFSFDTDTRIEHIREIFPSMAAHRSMLNGRVIPHGFVQLFLMMPKIVFNVFNALNTVLIAVLVCFILGTNFKRCSLLCLCGAFMLWNFTPAFGQNFFWLDGAVNYSWAITVLLLFLLPYIRDFLGRKSAPPALLTVLSVPFGFVAGSWSENGSIAAIFAAVCLSVLIYIKEKKISLPRILSLLFAIAGFVFLMSAPATAGRAGEMSLSALAASLKNVVGESQKVLLLPYIIYFVSFFLAFSSGDRKKLALSAIFFLAGLGSLCSFVFANYFTPRHFFVTIVFTVIAVLINFDLIMDAGSKKLVQGFTAACAVVFAFNFVLGAIDTAVIFGKSLERRRLIEEALSSGEKNVCVEAYQPSTPYSAAYGLEDLHPDPKSDTWPNISIAMYYGLNMIEGYYP